MNNFKRLALAVCAALTLASGAAQASGDITVVNNSPSYMSPYVKTNCWAPGFVDEGPDTWVYFGSLWPYNQFTWPEFQQLLDPRCKNPVVKFTFVETGAEPPVAADPAVTQLIHFDATENYGMVLGSKVVITERP